MIMIKPGEKNEIIGSPASPCVIMLIYRMESGGPVVGLSGIDRKDDSVS